MLNKKQTQLRELYGLVAKQMQQRFSFANIVQWFFECGIIDKAEHPYPDHYTSKYDYVMDKLTESNRIKEILCIFVPKLLDLISEEEFLESVSHGEVVEIEEILRAYNNRMTQLSKNMGFREVYNFEEDPFPTWIPPKTISKKMLMKEYNNLDLKEVVINGSTDSKLNGLLKELNDNLLRKNIYSCALLIRAIATIAIFIAFKKIGKEHFLKGNQNDDLELSKCLSICQQEFKISNTIMARITKSKWIGDSANHSYHVKINENDIQIASTGLRLFLEELLSR